MGKFQKLLVGLWRGSYNGVICFLQSMPNDPAYKKYPGCSNAGMNCLLSLFATALSWLILVVFLSSRLRLNPGEAILTLSTSLSVPDKNVFQVKNILGLNALFYVYLAFILAAGLAYLLKSPGSSKDRPMSRDFQPLYSVGLIFALLISGLQILAHSEQYKLYRQKSLEEKIAIRFKNSYQFARYCQRNFPGKHWGIPITDMDTTQSHGMLTFAAIAYYLYPIDIRIDKGHPKDCLIIFAKDDPLTQVADGYVAMPPFDKKSLIAIKQ